MTQTLELQIDEIGGNCPVQATGTIDGFAFYFRARGTVWSFEVLCGTPAWEYCESYGDTQYAAGWMSEEEAKIFIEQAARLFHERS